MNEPLNPHTRSGLNEEITYLPVQPVSQPPVEALPVTSQYSYSQTGDTKLEAFRQSYYDPVGNLVEKQEQVLNDTYARRLNILERTCQVIYLLVGLVAVLLALRFLSRLLGADSTSGFTSFIYSFTAPLVGPFNGIFHDQALNKTSLAELSTLLSIVIYSLIAYFVVKILYVLFAPDRSSQAVFTSSRSRRRGF